MRRTPFQRRNATPAFVERSDGELLSCFIANRDERVFTALIERHEPMVRGVCEHVLHHHQDAEDAAQRTFLVLWKNAETIRKRESLRNWLYGVARRVAKNVRKSKKRHKSHEKPCDLAQIAQIAQIAKLNDEPELCEVRALVAAAEVRGLPKKYRTLIMLHYWEDKSKAEIAAELDLPKGTASSQLERARKFLWKRLVRRGITTPD